MVSYVQYVMIRISPTNRILGYIPLSALFILFDFVIHNPTHPDTRKNLAFLDIAAGYFTRLEFATEGSLQSSLLAEFAYIARQYVQDCQRLPNPQIRSGPAQDTADGTSNVVVPGQQINVVSFLLYHSWQM